MVLSDKAGEGTLATTNISGMYAYQLNVNRKFSMRFGLQATYVQKRLDWDKLTFGDMIDPRYGYVYATQETRPNESKSFADFSAGVLAYSSKEAHPINSVLCQMKHSRFNRQGQHIPGLLQR